MADIIQKRTVKLGTRNNPNGKYILYWMQSNQRTTYNLALDFALHQSQILNLPLVVYFSIIPGYPSANRRHYSFMLHNIALQQKKLEKLGIKFIIKIANPIKEVVGLSKQAKILVLDKGYLSNHKSWYEQLYLKSHCQIYQIEDNVLVPVESVSQKEEYTAATLRGKYMRIVREYFNMQEMEEYERFSGQLWQRQKLKKSQIAKINDGLEVGWSVEEILNRLKLDNSVELTSKCVKSGEDEAISKLDDFLSKKLFTYNQNRNEYDSNNTSKISTYLHFGQISPIYIMRHILSKFREKAGYSDEISKQFRLCDSLGLQRDLNIESFIEELLIRRELAINFVSFNNDYDNFNSLQSWAKNTLLKHKEDKRPYIYTLEQLKNGGTHDNVWNTAQMNMVEAGYMHGYLRMYWGKRVIEWTEDPVEAYDNLVYLNDKYQLDGRDPNGYAGIAWCFGKHDRPWKEREIFGIVRWMKSRG